MLWLRKFSRGFAVRLRDGRRTATDRGYQSASPDLLGRRQGKILHCVRETDETTRLLGRSAESVGQAMRQTKPPRRERDFANEAKVAAEAALYVNKLDEQALLERLDVRIRSRR